MHPALAGLAGGVIIAAMNMIGASLVLLIRDPSDDVLGGSLGFAAGIMTSAAFTSLFIPGIEHASQASYRAVSVFGVRVAGIAPVIVGFLAAVVVFDNGDAVLSRIGQSVGARVTADGGVTRDGPETVMEWFDINTDVSRQRVYGLFIFIAAITLHNMPEGMAVGVAYGAGNIANAVTLTLAIGMQNIPEGFAVSVAVLGIGLQQRWYAVVTGIRAGLVEIPITVFGAWVVAVASPLLPYAMGFAGAGMLYVIVSEVVPQAHDRGDERATTLGFMAGAGLMLTLDVVIA